ncbi:MAG: hypothetical protein ABF899_01590 [Oenococcus sp.]|uniref:hypothetical protein n=1 Tax=Oenococcus sp. TaxID=1979414 RepID=UPI0039EBCA81
MTFRKVGMYLNEGNFTRTLYGADILKPFDNLYIHEPVKLPKFIAERLDLVIKADGIVDVIRSQEFYFDSYELNPEIVSWYNDGENYRKIAEALLYGFDIEDEK